MKYFRIRFCNAFKFVHRCLRASMINSFNDMLQKRNLNRPANVNVMQKLQNGSSFAAERVNHQRLRLVETSSN